MAELLGAGEVLDEALTAALGPVDHVTGDVIAGICNDALEDVLGPDLVSVLGADRHLLPLVAPWVWDLACGLQFQSHNGPAEPATAELLACLSRRELAVADTRRFAEAVDLAAVLTLDRVLEQVLGPEASARDPRANEAAAPWLTGLKLGSRIHLVLELLRLLLPVRQPDPADGKCERRQVSRNGRGNGRLAGRACLRQSASRAAQPLPDWPGESRRSANSSVWSSASS